MTARAHLVLCTLVAGAAVCMAALPVLVPERWELLAFTPDGNVWIAGSGSTCAAAFEGAVYPEGWRELRCIRR